MEINKIYCADSLEFFKSLKSESVNCIVTSPPYFNLRDYGVDGQLGLEKTYKEYLQKLIDIFNEAKRVLKKDGSCFINLGDSYGTISGGMRAGDMGLISNRAIQTQRFEQNKEKKFEKSLMLIPHRFAIEMIDNGWKLRNTLVWIKKNAMPESVQDRWKKAHEYIFFFVKSKKYYFNLDAIRNPHKDISIKREEYELGRNALGQNSSSLNDKSSKYGMPARQVKLNPKGSIPPDYLEVMTNTKQAETSTEHFATYSKKLIIPLIKAGSRKNDVICDPFMGSGTTAIAALELDRQFIGCDISQKYCDIAQQRIDNYLKQPKLL